MDSDTKNDQWSKLPKDLLIVIAKLLDTRTDILRLRAVCSSWRSFLPCSLKKSPLFSVKFPFPITHHNRALNPNRRGYFTLSERTIYYLQPCTEKNPKAKGWMVKIEEEKPGEMRILDPLSKVKFTESPKVSPKVLNLLNFRVSEVSKVWNLQFVNLRDDLETDFNELKSMNVKKVVMSPMPAWFEDISGDCAILTIHTGGKLGYFKLWDKKWFVINDGQNKSSYDDIAFRNGKFYAVDIKGRMIVIDSSLNVRVIESPVRPYRIQYAGQHKYLIESCGDLYLVDKFMDMDQEMFYDEEIDDYVYKEGNPDCMIYFKVYKLNDEEQQWVQVTSTGDQAFFIGDDCCFSMSATQFSGCKGNCIYYTELLYTSEADDHPGYDVGMFDLEKHISGHLSFFKGYSRIFWPPPTWLKPKASSSKC